MEKIQFFITSVLGHTLCSPFVDKNMTVRELYQYLYKHNGHDEGVLLFRGRILDNPDVKLCDIGVLSCSTVMYVGRGSVHEIMNYHYTNPEDRFACCICYENFRGKRYELFPCYHNNFCKDCALKFVNVECPLCKKHVETAYMAQYQ